MSNHENENQDIEVNKRDGNEILFESTTVQNAYNHIRFFRGETDRILKKLDVMDLNKQINEFDAQKFSENIAEEIIKTIDIMYDAADEVIMFDDIPDFIDESAISAKKALNRDADYIRKAERKLKYLNSDGDNDKINQRIVELCNKAIEVNIRNYDAHYLKGIALINLKKYDDGIEELINAMAINGDSPDLRLEIAEANRLNGDYQDAVSVYDSVLKMNGNSFDAFKGKAHTYFDWEKYGKCNEYFQKASDIGFLDEGSIYKWIITCNKLGEYEKADMLLKKVKWH